MASVYICVRLERMEPWIMVNIFFETLILHIAIISLCLATMLIVQDDKFIQGDLCASCPTLLVSH